jgi:predicted metal-binding membrane protein
MSMMSMSVRPGASWSLIDGVFTFTMWTVMMVGMMAPSAMPVLLVFGASRVRRAERGGAAAVVAFGLGYIAVWAGFSAFAALAQGGLHRAALLSPAMATTSAPLAAAVLVAAGVYQLTPLKYACLSHCQSPMGFLMSHWREGRSGAFQMGLSHGVYCVGCCWALMVVLFVVGVMNLLWVAVLAGFVLVEKLGYGGHWVSRAGGVLLVAAGIATLAIAK